MVTTDQGRRRGAATYRRGQAFRRRARRNVVRPRTTPKTATTTEFAHTRGHPQGVPQRPERYVDERWFVHTRGCTHGARTPTRGAYGPNDMATSVGFCAREGAYKGGGHPQGVPLRPERYGNERWFVRTRGRPQGGRAPTRGAPTARTIWQRALVFAHERAPTRGEGAHKGCPYGPNDMATSVGFCAREGAYKGGGHPQGVPLRPERYGNERWFLRTRGHPQGVPLRPERYGNERWFLRTRGHPQGVPLRPERYGNERWFLRTRGRLQGGRAPTRGAPTARTIWQRALVKLAAISWQALSDPRCGRRYFLEYALYHPRRETAAPRG